LRVLFPALFLSALVPAVAAGQVNAPSLVDEELEPEPAKQPPSRAVEPAPERTARQAEPARVAPPPVPAPPIPIPAPEPRAAPEAKPAEPRPAEPDPIPRAAAGTADGQSIQKVKVRLDDLVAHWQARREALREHDVKKARAGEALIREAREELGIENLAFFSAALNREAMKALQSRAPAEAVDRAGLAVELAPDLPAAHLTLARALFGKDPGALGPIFSALGGAASAAWRSPLSRRALLADVSGALLAGLSAAIALGLLLLVARRLHLFLHGFHHLFAQGASRAQTGFLAVVLLAVPLAMRWGPFATAVVWIFCVWRFLRSPERAVAVISLAVLVGMPWAIQEVARATSWAGGLAAQVYALERGAGLGDAAGQLARRAEAGELPAPALMALGRFAKRHGDLEGANRWYQQALQADSRSAAILVNVGNVHFLKGDLEAAKAAYIGATDRAESDSVAAAAAHFNLGRLFFRQGALDKGQEARSRALQLFPALGQRRESQDDLRANAYLLDVPVSDDQIAELASLDQRHQAVGEQARARIFGPIPRWPVLPGALVALLGLFALVSRKPGAIRPCNRCGGAACRRCYAEANDSCGQCINVFVKKGAVDARDRLRKEDQVRRFRQRSQLITRALAVMTGGAGHVYDGKAVSGFLLLFGLFFLGFWMWFAPGILPPAQPAPQAPVLKLLLALPVFIPLYLLSVRSAFQLTGR
jgi:tetratricopeptide (TPR) repeat protein